MWTRTAGPLPSEPPRHRSYQSQPWAILGRVSASPNLDALCAKHVKSPGEPKTRLAGHRDSSALAGGLCPHHAGARPAASPSAGLRITVVVEPRFAAIFEANPDVNYVSSGEKLLSDELKADLVLNLHGGTRSMFITLASRARFRAGFAHHAWSKLYNVRIPRAQEILCVDRKVHTAEHLASAMFYLGVPPSEIPPAGLFATERLRIPKPYASSIHSRRQPGKAWPAERFAGHRAPFAGARRAGAGDPGRSWRRCGCVRAILRVAQSLSG